MSTPIAKSKPSSGIAGDLVVHLRRQYFGVHSQRKYGSSYECSSIYESDNRRQQRHHRVGSSVGHSIPMTLSNKKIHLFGLSCWKRSTGKFP